MADTKERISSPAPDCPEANPKAVDAFWLFFYMRLFVLAAIAPLVGFYLVELSWLVSPGPPPKTILVEELAVAALSIVLGVGFFYITAAIAAAMLGSLVDWVFYIHYYLIMPLLAFAKDLLWLTPRMFIAMLLEAHFRRNKPDDALSLAAAMLLLLALSATLLASQFAWWYGLDYLRQLKYAN